MLVAEGVEGEGAFATFGGVIGILPGDHSLAVGHILSFKENSMSIQSLSQVSRGKMGQAAYQMVF